MEELYLETQNGNILIDQDIIEKYNLKKGTLSPFTRSRIVDINGDYSLERPLEKGSSDHAPGEEVDEGFINDGIVELDNGLTLSISEMIDIAQGADSSDD